jgi:pimeloyl-ACP methyl ester carboxylesterase
MRLDVPTLFIWGEDDPFLTARRAEAQLVLSRAARLETFRAATSLGSMTPTSAHPRSLRF